MFPRWFIALQLVIAAAVGFIVRFSLPGPQQAQCSLPAATTAARYEAAPPAPRSGAGYAAMFAHLDQRQWAAADVAITVPLPDGRVVWLFGDTFSTRGFVHSTAIVQDGGQVHVTNRGAQLLPNIDAQHIFWIRAARAARGSGVLVTARAITLTGHGPWDFRDGGYDQRWLVTFDAAGNARAPLAGVRIHSAAPNPGPMYVYGPHHFGYQRRVHPELRLAGGRVLVTTSQNWDDGRLHPLADYRPIFSEAVAPAGR